MEFYVYKHTVKRGKSYPLIFSCDNCYSEIVGVWEYEDKPIKYKGEYGYQHEIDLLDELFLEGKKFTVDSFKNFLTWSEAKYVNVNSICPQLENVKIYDKSAFEKGKRILQSEKYNQVKEYQKELLKFLKLDKCPVCGKKLSQEWPFGFSDVYLLPEEIKDSIEVVNGIYSLESAIEYVRDSRHNNNVWIAIQKTEKFNEKYDKKVDDVENPINNIVLKDYLYQLLILHKDIFAILERLKELYALEIEADKNVYCSEQLTKNLPKKLLKSYNEFKKQDPTKKIKLGDFPIKYPSKPKKPIEPMAPVYEKPGFFNKRRVLEKNAFLKQKYEVQLSVYEQNKNKYTVDMDIYNQTIENLKKEQSEKYIETIEKVKNEHFEKCEKLKREYENAVLEYEEYKELSSANKTPEKTKQLLIKEEISKAEDLLKNLYIARNELYSYNIVFEKYRDFVTLATFYEYISSGRCKTLDGHEGAYNIYENEIRMNIVISQLTEVINSLNKIKQNQYIIYSAIQESNEQLNSLNVSMNNAVDSLEKIRKSTSSIKTCMKKIEDNTELAAYNTAMTAFYAKKNAELTNALGYMVALS